MVKPSAQPDSDILQSPRIAGKKRTASSSVAATLYCADIDDFYSGAMKKARLEEFHDARGSVVVRVIDTEGGEKPVTYVVPKKAFENDVKSFCDWHEDPYCALSKFPDNAGSRVADLMDLWHMYIISKAHVGEPVCVINIEYERLVDGYSDNDEQVLPSLVELDARDKSDEAQ